VRQSGVPSRRWISEAAVIAVWLTTDVGFLWLTVIGCALGRRHRHDHPGAGHRTHLDTSAPRGRRDDAGVRPYLGVGGFVLELDLDAVVERAGALGEAESATAAANPPPRSTKSS